MQWNSDWYSAIAFLLHVDPCMVVSPPCMNEADRYSLEALRSIHQMMDDDKDGGIEVEESVEVQNSLFIKCVSHFYFLAVVIRIRILFIVFGCFRTQETQTA